MKLTIEEQKRHRDGMVLLNILSTETSVIQKPLTPSGAANVPDNTSHDILKIIKATPRHEVYGSLAMQTKTFSQRSPNDIDMVVGNPGNVSNKIERSLRSAGHNVNVEHNKEYGSYVVQTKKGKEWIDVADIHPIKEHKQEFDVYGKSIPPKRVGGINVQVAADQLLRKANSVMAYDSETQTFGAQPHRKQKDVADFVSTSRLLLDSKQLQAEAELAKVRKGRRALKSWQKHAKKVGAKAVKDPIPETQEQRFIRHAVDNPDLNVETLTFRNKTHFNARSGKRKSKKPDWGDKPDWHKSGY